MASQGPWFTDTFTESMVKLLERGRVEYALAPGRQILRTGSDQVAQMTSLRARTALSFFTYHVDRLEAPYETDCIHYRQRDAGIRTRFDCYELCVKNYSISKWRKMLPRISVPLNCSYKFMSQLQIDSNVTLKSEISKLKVTCDYLCRKRDCNSTTLETIVLSFIDVSFLSEARFNARVMSIENPTSPVAQTLAVAKLDFAEYASYVTGALSFWVGLVALHCLKDVYGRIFHLLSLGSSNSVTRPSRINLHPLASWRPNETFVSPGHGTNIPMDQDV